MEVENKIMKIAKYFALVIFCTMMLTVIKAVASPAINAEVNIESALAAVNNKEYKKAFEQFQLLAEKGDADAQHNLAMLYRSGEGVNKNLALSSDWFRKAADQGVTDAQYYLGHAYDSGEGVTKNKTYAFVWYRKAAEKGHGLAQINLGVLYANGLGVEQNIEQAYLWFHVAAVQGYKAAFENKEIIEKALKPEELEGLKKRARSHYQQYVKPFQRHSKSYPRLR